MKWAKELPKEEGWYWFRNTGHGAPVTGMNYYIVKDNGVYISRLGQLVETGEAEGLYFYGPIEPPEFEEETANSGGFLSVFHLGL